MNRSVAAALWSTLFAHGVMVAQDPPILLDSLVVTGSSTPSVEHEGVPPAIAMAVANQLSSELNLYGTAEQVVSSQIRLVRLQSVPLRNLRLWRADLSRIQTHRPPYLVSASDHGIYRLGGFPAPELLSLSEYITPDSPSIGDPVDLARMYATLADPNGAAELVFIDE